MTPPESGGPSLFEAIWSALLFVVGALATLVKWNVVQIKGDVSKLQERSERLVTREELTEHVMRRDKEFERLHGNIRELYGRDDKIKEYIHSEMTLIRKEMTEGFTRISDQLRAK